MRRSENGFRTTRGIQVLSGHGAPLGHERAAQGMGARRWKRMNTTIRSHFGTSSPRPAFTASALSEEFGGQGGDVVMQMLLARELARSLGGLAWIWGITSFAGSKSIGLYGSARAEGAFLPLIATGQLQRRDRLHRAGRRHRRAGRDAATTAERVDGGWIAERREDLVVFRPCRRLSAAARAHRQERREAASGPDAVLRAGEARRA